MTLPNGETGSSVTVGLVTDSRQDSTGNASTAPIDLVGAGSSASLTHDIAAMYTALFGRSADAAGQAYWTEQVQQGHLTFVQVADSLLTSAEMTGHNKAPANWDFTVWRKTTRAARRLPLSLLLNCTPTSARQASRRQPKAVRAPGSSWSPVNVTIRLAHHRR